MNYNQDHHQNLIPFSLDHAHPNQNFIKARS